MVPEYANTVLVASSFLCLSIVALDFGLVSASMVCVSKGHSALWLEALFRQGNTGSFGCVGNSTRIDVDGNGSPGYMGELESCLGISAVATHWNYEALVFSFGRPNAVDFGTFYSGFLVDKCFCPTIRIFNKQMFGMGSVLKPGSLEVALEKKCSVIANK